MIHQNIIIITGRSGSGKSTAIAALEDAGFYCVDNLPVTLLPKFLNLSMERSSDFTGFAFVMDLRDRGFITKYAQVFSNLLDEGHSIEIIYLEADEKTLLQRFKQTRRPHPLATKKSLLQGIRSEINLLADLRKTADRVIDTTNCTVHELKFLILKIVQKETVLVPMIIQIISFGFKYGSPFDADLIIDIRFLTNPYFVPELRPLDGTSKRIKSFVLNNPETSLFLQKYLNLLDYLIPLYEKEGKAYLTVAVGCTGGRHRSVVIANFIGEHISKMHKQFTITHRDIGHSSNSV
jgi:RNase adapter protein RapZ